MTSLQLRFALLQLLRLPPPPNASVDAVTALLGIICLVVVRGDGGNHPSILMLVVKAPSSWTP